MENKKENSRQLIFLEPVNSNSGVEDLLNKLVLKLEALVFNITKKEEDKKDEDSMGRID
tara:strand:+ start:599 stop:775 length:177 start_codon:yes stop_codon:yes gene_type:complete